MKFLITIFSFIFFSIAYSSDIAVVTIAAGNEYQQVVSPAIENKKKYCELHGYDFLLCNEVLDPSRPPSWSKVLLLGELLENSSYKWLFWTDADSLIMNYSIRLEDLIDDRYDMIITRDFASICAGEFFLKKSEWSKQFLKDIYTHTECINHGWWEQCAMIEELKIKPYLYDHILILPQRIMNSFSKEVFGHHVGEKEIYQRGDFIFHFAAARGALLDGLMKKYSQEVINDSTLFTLNYYLGIYGLTLSSNSLQEQQFAACLETYPLIQNILQIGLNQGRTAEFFFNSCPNLQKLITFDKNLPLYTKPAKEYFSRKYRNRFFFVEGDPLIEVLKYNSKNPEDKYDLIHIEGSPSSAFWDILNASQLAHANTILWIENYYSPVVQQAVQRCVDEKIIEVTGVHNSNNLEEQRDWIEARYI